MNKMWVNEQILTVNTCKAHVLPNKVASYIIKRNACVFASEIFMCSQGKCLCVRKRNVYVFDRLSHQTLINRYSKNEWL